MKGLCVTCGVSPLAVLCLCWKQPASHLSPTAPTVESAEKTQTSFNETQHYRLKQKRRLNPIDQPLLHIHTSHVNGPPPPHGATMNWSVSCFRSYCQWKVAVSEDVQCRPKSVVDWFTEFDSVLSLFVWLAWYWWSHIWRGRGRRYGRGKITLLLRSIFLIYLVLLSQIISFFFSICSYNL